MGFIRIIWVLLYNTQGKTGVTKIPIEVDPKVHGDSAMDSRPYSPQNVRTAPKPKHAALDFLLHLCVSLPLSTAQHPPQRWPLLWWSWWWHLCTLSSVVHPLSLFQIMLWLRALSPSLLGRCKQSTWGFEITLNLGFHRSRCLVQWWESLRPIHSQPMIRCEPDLYHKEHTGHKHNPLTTETQT